MKTNEFWVGDIIAALRLQSLEEVDLVMSILGEGLGVLTGRKMDWKRESESGYFEV